MSIEKETISQSPTDTFNAVTAHLSSAVSEGSLIAEVKSVATAAGQDLPAEATVDKVGLEHIHIPTRRSVTSASMRINLGPVCVV